jgi:4-carboxymuconolactone decarboxylase
MRIIHPVRVRVSLAVAVFALVGLVAMLGSACVRADDRLPALPLDKYTEVQKKAARDFAADRGKTVFGPFVPLLRSPELMLGAKAMGDYLRFKSSLPKRIGELAVLVVCREWTQQVEWQIHYPLALQSGVSREVADAIADGRRPDKLKEDEQVAYDLSIEILRNRRVSDETYRRAVAAFGEQGVVDLLGVNGYYVFLATVMNAARTAVPMIAAVPLRQFPD